MRTIRRHSRLSARPLLRAGAALLAASLLASCAPAVLMRALPFAASRARPDGVRGTTGDDEHAPKVVVRSYRLSPAVNVVAWSPDEAYVGLRARVLRDGTLSRDHSLYVSTYYFTNTRDFFGATWHAFAPNAEEGQPLESGGLLRDTESCRGNQGCSPYVSFVVRVPEKMLRAPGDSLLVKVYGRNSSEDVVTIYRPLIDAYLAKVDSVRAVLRYTSRATNAEPRAP
jgi:hypothetical protein